MALVGMTGMLPGLIRIINAILFLDARNAALEIAWLRWPWFLPPRSEWAYAAFTLIARRSCQRVLAYGSPMIGLGVFAKDA